jgi:hypothetical protein
MVASCLAVGGALAALWEQVRRTVWAGLPLLVAAGFPLLLFPLTDARSADVISYYRVVDGSLLRTAAWLDANHGGRTVVVREDRHGWPVGWWFEGLTSARVIVGTNTKWLAFPQERANADLAAEIFDHRSTTDRVVDLAAGRGIELLVFRKWEWIGWQAWLAEPHPSVRVVYDDGDFMVLELGDRAAASRLGR